MTRLERLRERYARGELSLEDFEANVGQLLAEEREDAPAEVIGGRHDGARVLSESEWRERFERRHAIESSWDRRASMRLEVLRVLLAVIVPVFAAILGAYLALRGQLAR